MRGFAEVQGAMVFMKVSEAALGCLEQRTNASCRGVRVVFWGEGEARGVLSVEAGELVDIMSEGILGGGMKRGSGTRIQGLFERGAWRNEEWCWENIGGVQGS